MADTSYQPNIYRKQGGDEMVVASGGTVTVESGGVIALESGSTFSVASGGSISVASGGIVKAVLPTTDPGVAHQLWNSTAVGGVAVSTG